MNETKKPWQSMTMQGGTIAGLGATGGIAPVLSLMLSSMGHDVATADVQGALQGIEQILTGVGAVMAIWGRARASSRIAR